MWVSHIDPYNMSILQQPEQVSGLSNITYITDFDAMRSDGTVWDYSLENKTSYQVPIDDVAVLDNRIAVKNDGTVWDWSGDYDRYEDGTNKSITPTEVKGLADVEAVSGGSIYCLALKKDGTLWAWGDNTDGNLGNSSIDHVTFTPVQVQGIADIDTIYAGRGGVDASFVSTRNGTVWAFGNDLGGDLGNGAITVPALKVHGSGIDYPVRTLLDAGVYQAPATTPVPVTDTATANPPIVTPMAIYDTTSSPIVSESTVPTGTPLPGDTPGVAQGFSFDTIAILGCLLVTSSLVSTILKGNRK